MKNASILSSAARGLALAALLTGASTSLADVKLAALFGDHMVLQQDATAPIWGTATAGEKVTVKLGDQETSATAGADGKWMAKLAALKTSGPLEMTVAGRNTITVHDVLVGEVWVCSGQSNMGMQVGGVKDKAKEIAEADHPQLRMFTVANTAVDEPPADVRGHWVVCTPKDVAGFSATAYFFGRDLQEAIKRPVGLINTSWGGTAIQPWISPAALEAEPLTKPDFEKFKKLPAPTEEQVTAYKKALAEWQKASAEARKDGKKIPQQPARPQKMPGEPNLGRLYNGMVAPLIPYAIRGAVWYQGEANGGQGILYRTWLPQMITDWRTHWNQAGAGHDFPFLVVQLPNNGARSAPGAENVGWTLIRESEAKVGDKTPNVGYAVTIDTSADGNLHPPEKQPVGHRLALVAENKFYGMKDVPSSGPVLDSAKPEAGKLKITFKETDGGLVAKGGKLVGFYVAGEDRKFYPAEATIEGDSVVLHSEQVAHPVAARYAWAQNPECNLFNKADLPAGPFRTDDWDQSAAAKPAPRK